MGPKVIPNGMNFWPEKAIELSTAEVIKTYEDGFAGAFEEPLEREAFEDDIKRGGGYIYGADAASAAGWAESGKGKLIVPFVWVILNFGKCWPGKRGQGRGDCVSWAERNANLLSYACEIQDGKPDEVTGKPEQVPEIPAAGIADGCFSTETFYWFRRHGGDGWSCDASARVAMREGGLVTRADHTSTLGVDLSSYSARVAGRYGRTPPSGSVADALDNNLVRTATTLRTKEERRDFLNNGYGINSCGSEGLSSKRDENGVSRRRGSWAHAMALIGFDDRPSIVNLYGDTLELLLNSWAIWNSGPRDIRESEGYVNALVEFICKTRNKDEEFVRRWLVELDLVNQSTGRLMIPKGSCWVPSRDISRRRYIAKSSVAGWPKREIYIPFDLEGKL